MATTAPPKTFTPYRILFLLLVPAVFFIATALAAGISHPELLHAVIEHAGERPVVTTHLVPGVTIR